MAFQDWQIPENGSLKLLWRKGTAYPNINFDVHLEDVFGEPEASEYTTLEYCIAPYGHPSWIDISGDADIGVWNTISGTGIQLNLDATLTAAANTLNSGSTYASIGIFIAGTNGSVTREIITYTSLVVYLDVFSETQPIAIPSFLDFTHEFQAVGPDYELMQFDAVGEWEITLGSPNIVDALVVSGILNITTETDPIFGFQYLKLTGNGSGSINIRPTQEYVDGLAISNDAYSIVLGAFTSSTQSTSGWYSFQQALRILVVEATEIVIDVDSLYFHAIKTVFEAGLQTINVDADFDYTITAPSWANLSSYGDVAGVSNIDITVALSDTLGANTYTGNLIFEYDNGNGVQQFLLPITYLVEGFVVLPYNPEEFNFTLDNKMVDFSTDLENTFFNILMNVKTYDFYSSSFNDYIVPLKIPLLNGKQRENIGLKIHRIMKRMGEVLNLSDAKQYRTCEVYIEVKELDLDTLEIQREFTLENVKFIAGVEPELSNGMGILSIDKNPIRVTASGKQFVNLLVKSGSRKIEIYNNEELISSYFINGLEFNVYKDEIDFSVLDVTKGDVVEYRLYTDDVFTEYVSRVFKVFPDSINNIRIIWEDEYKLQSTFEFTGEYKIKTDFSSKSFKKYRDIVEVLENIQTGKNIKISINTGFILKSNQVTIESICRSRRAWLLIDNQEIEIIPQTKSITNVDSEKELISFDLDFIINRKLNEEVYTF